jgi:YfiH family protein
VKNQNYFYQFKIFEEYSHCIHAVTTKRCSEPYRFSLALHTGDEAKSIIKNRQKLSSLLGSEGRFAFIVANQTHSDHVTIITQKHSKGWESLEDAVAECDALVTDKKEVVLTILTADCVPILLYDTKKEVIATVHAGWRGTEKKIVEKTVQKMVEVFGSKPKDIIAGIAPSIGRCCYEVGKEVAEHFFDQPESLVSVGEKYMLDLPLINKKQLLDIGVNDANIEMSGICTACETESFFSYRKEQGCTGRFMSLIGLRA